MANNLSPKAKIHKAEYDAEYNKKYIVMKHVMFNRVKDEDMELLKWLNEKPSASAYIRDLIRADYEAHKNV